MHLRLILLIVIESIRRLIDDQIKFRYILTINSSRLMKLLRIERFRESRLIKSIIGEWKNLKLNFRMILQKRVLNLEANLTIILLEML
mgnify:FL=1